MDKEMISLRTRLCALLTMLPYSLRDIAKQIGIGNSTLNSFKSGGIMNRINLQKVRKYVERKEIELKVATLQ